MKKGSTLFNIATGIRQSFSAGLLEKSQIEHLEKNIFFKWKPNAFIWLEQYKGLRRWSPKNKSSTPPRGTFVLIRIGKEKYIKRDLCQFRSASVSSYNRIEKEQGSDGRKNHLKPRQIKALEKIPFWAWSIADAKWKEAFLALLKFVSENGNPYVPATDCKVTLQPSGRIINLSRWCSKQRFLYAKSELKAIRVKQLNAVNFDWTGQLIPKVQKSKLDESDLDERVSRLARWVDIHGHAYVRQKETFENTKLGLFVAYLRNAYAEKKNYPMLPTDIINTVDALHPTWLWSGIDARYTKAFAASDQCISALMKTEGDHKVNRIIRYAVYAGLRITDINNFEITQHHGVRCFYLPERAGYKERYIPTHFSLVDIAPLKSNYQTLASKFNRLDVLKLETKEESQFFSLHLSFREKLIKIGLNAQIVNGLSGFNPRMEWSVEEMETIKDAINQISYE